MTPFSGVWIGKACGDALTLSILMQFGLFLAKVEYCIPGWCSLASYFICCSHTSTAPFLSCSVDLRFQYVCPRSVQELLWYPVVGRLELPAVCYFPCLVVPVLVVQGQRQVARRSSKCVNIGWSFLRSSNHIPHCL